MATKHKLIASCPFANSDDGIEVEITFNFTRGSGDYWNKSGGHWEQGYSAEVELVSAKPVDASLVLPSNLQPALLEWAELYLAGDRGYDEALDAVADDDEAAREYAAELRRDL